MDRNDSETDDDDNASNSKISLANESTEIFDPPPAISPINSLLKSKKMKMK